MSWRIRYFFISFLYLVFPHDSDSVSLASALDMLSSSLSSIQTTSPTLSTSTSQLPTSPLPYHPSPTYTHTPKIIPPSLQNPYTSESYTVKRERNTPKRVFHLVHLVVGSTTSHRITPHEIPRKQSLGIEQCTR
jgi:hypothetical protein